MSRVLIGLYDFNQVEPSKWQVRFEIELVGCSAGTGDFEYRLVLQSADGSINYAKKRSIPYTPADGPAFIMQLEEDTEPQQRIVGVDGITSHSHRCDAVSIKQPIQYPTNFDPYESCKKTVGLQARSALAAISLLYEVAVIYDMFRNESGNQDIQNFLEKTLDALNKISDRLGRISDQLDELQNLLLNLPEKIRGIVELNSVKEKLGIARGYSQIIADNSKPVNFEITLPQLSQAVDALQVTLNGIVGVTGVTGHMIISPYMAIWLAGSVAVQKIRQRLYPEYTISSPWNSSFMAFYAGGLKKLLEDFDGEDIKYRTVYLPAFQTVDAHYGFTYGQIWILGGEYFIKAQSHPHGINPGQYNVGEFVLRCSDDGKHDVMYVVRDLMNQDPPFPIGIRFEELTTQSVQNPTENRYLQIYKKLTSDRQEIAAFYAVASPVANDREKLLGALFEPTGLWV